MPIQPIPPPAGGAGRSRPLLRGSTALVLVAMIVGVLWIYLPMESFDGKTLFGMDYLSLHHFRIQYAKDALFGDRPHLPGWHTRELMGSPFWSNIQSFPFIPTRMPLLFSPPDMAYQIGIVLAALLSAVFTYLYCRSRDMGRLGAAIAGWTFACSGWFAARVLAGHLPLLEAYPALPLLLWLAETAIQREEANRSYRLRLLALGLATLAVILSGHPQLPIYAVVVTGCYVLYRDFSRRAAKRVAVLCLGVSAAAFVLWPMLQLVRRSTRILDLEVAANNAVFPFERIAAFLFPWTDGWPAVVGRPPAVPFSGYPHISYFWDTVCYVGVLPIAALIVLLAAAVLRRCRGQRLWSQPWPFFFVAGALALLTALPPVQLLVQQIPGTFLRSPARQIYVTIFCLSLGLGAMVSLLLKHRTSPGWRKIAAWGLALVCIGVQLYDLHAHDRWYIQFGTIDRRDDALDRRVRTQLGDQRVAVDRGLYGYAVDWRFDDPGFFDSVILSRPYRAVMSLSNQPSRKNLQVVDSRRMNARALSYLGVKLLCTTRPHKDARPVPGRPQMRAFEIPDPSPRAAFFPRTSARFFDGDRIHKTLRNRRIKVRDLIMLPPEAKPEGFGSDPADGRGAGIEGRVTYRRIDSDNVSCAVRAEREGYLRLLESWDPGWKAHVDGEPAEIIIADDFAMAVHLRPGRHEVAFEYSTPGKWTGFAISLVSLALMVLLIFSRSPKRLREGAGPPSKS